MVTLLVEWSSVMTEEEIVTYIHTFILTHMSLVTREASGSYKEPFIHISILEIPAGQRGIPSTKLKAKPGLFCFASLISARIQLHSIKVIYGNVR